MIGVGGGSLPLFLARHLGFRVDAVELDPVVLDLAQQHFAFANGTGLQVQPCALRFCGTQACTLLVLWQGFLIS